MWITELTAIDGSCIAMKRFQTQCALASPPYSLFIESTEMLKPNGLVVCSRSYQLVMPVWVLLQCLVFRCQWSGYSLSCCSRTGCSYQRFVILFGRFWWSVSHGHNRCNQDLTLGPTNRQAKSLLHSGVEVSYRPLESGELVLCSYESLEHHKLHRHFHGLAP